MESAGNRIMVVDDDEHIRELMQLYLSKEGFEVVCACNGREALEKAGRERPHLLLLDIMMPELDGLAVCRELRQRNDNLPVILLTARGEDYDRILGLELGADDYITKPFNPREAVARVKAVLRRITERTTLPKSLYYPGLEIDIDAYRVLVGSKAVSLTHKEMELLWLLASRPNRVFTRQQLLEQIWGYEYCADTRTVDTHIKRLRKKLYLARDAATQKTMSGYFHHSDGAPPHPNPIPQNGRRGESEEAWGSTTCLWEIKTVWGVGYKFEVTG